MADINGRREMIDSGLHSVEITHLIGMTLEFQKYRVKRLNVSNILQNTTQILVSEASGSSVDQTTS